MHLIVHPIHCGTLTWEGRWRRPFSPPPAAFSSSECPLAWRSAAPAAAAAMACGLAALCPFGVRLRGWGVSMAMVTLGEEGREVVLRPTCGDPALSRAPCGELSALLMLMLSGREADGGWRGWEEGGSSRAAARGLGGEEVGVRLGRRRLRTRSSDMGPSASVAWGAVGGGQGEGGESGWRGRGRKGGVSSWSSGEGGGSGNRQFNGWCLTLAALLSRLLADLVSPTCRDPGKGHVKPPPSFI